MRAVRLVAAVFPVLTLTGFTQAQQDNLTTSNPATSSPAISLKAGHWIKVPGGLKEPVSGVIYPRVAGMTRLNLALQNRQLERANEAITCHKHLPQALATRTPDIQEKRDCTSLQVS